MASCVGEAARSGGTSQGGQASPTDSGDPRPFSGSEEKGGKSGPHSSSGGGENIVSLGLTSSLQPQPVVGGNSSDSGVHNTKQDDKNSRTKKENGTQDSRHSKSGSVKSKEHELWQRLESIMTAKQSHVQQVLEEFGIADVPPSSDPLEEQVWRVVQGELSLQEAADLV